MSRLSCPQSGGREKLQEAAVETINALIQRIRDNQRLGEKPLAGNDDYRQYHHVEPALRGTHGSPRDRHSVRGCKAQK